MARILSVAVLTILFSGALVATSSRNDAQQSQTPQIKKVPMRPTSPASGKEMYEAYCAACHGVQGKGNGPAAPAMKAPPTDLTQLSTRNGGKFPDGRVATVLQFGTPTRAHGSADMPVWGSLMRSTCGVYGGADVTQLRIHNITEYIRQLQK